jgi:hypothetical protein
MIRGVERVERKKKPSCSVEVKGRTSSSERNRRLQLHDDGGSELEVAICSLKAKQMTRKMEDGTIARLPVEKLVGYGCWSMRCEAALWKILSLGGC